MIEQRASTRSVMGPSICFVGVGGAGTRAASTVAKDLPLSIEAVLVDRHPDDLRGISFGTKVPVGYPLFAGRSRNGLTNGEPVDETDLLRVRSALNGFEQVYVMLGLGGKAGLELSTSVVETAVDVGAAVIVVCTMPFAFEGPLRRATAEETLRKLDDLGCPVALVDGDGALSPTVSIGDVAEELAKAQARTLMTLLTIGSNASSGALNGAGVGLELIAGSRRALVSHGTADSVEGARKAARDVVRNPLTSGLAISDASTLGVMISAPSDLPVKTLNGVMATIEREVPASAQLTTSFVPLPANSEKVRISLIAGDGAHEADSVDARLGDDADVTGLDSDALEPYAAVEAAERALAMRHGSGVGSGRVVDARSTGGERALL